MATRLDADALLDAVALQLPAARVSVRATRRRECAAAAGTTRVRAARHRHLRRRPLLGHHRRPMRRPTSTTSCIRIDGHAMRARCGAAARAADAVVPQHVVVGARRPPTRRCRSTAIMGRAPSTDCSGDAGRLTARRTAPALFCDNETNASGCGVDRSTPYPKDGINDHVVTARDDGQPRRAGTKAACWYDSTCPRRARQSCGCACGCSEPPDEPLGARASTRRWPRRRPRPTSSTRDARAGTRRRRSAVVHAPSARRDAVVEAVLPLRRGRWLDGDPAQPPPPAERTHGPQRGTGGISTTRRHLDARQVGVPVVRGVGPRVPLRRRSRTSTRSSPRSSSSCCAASGTCTPTASCPATSGPSATSTRRSMPGPRCGCSRSTARARLRLPRADASTSCC